MNIFIIIKSLVVVVCIALFLVLMKDVWYKYESKLTATGVQLRTERLTKKRLPLLTICPWPNFRKQGKLMSNTKLTS